MDVISNFAARYERTREEELSLEDYLDICKRDPQAYASAAERMLTAIGEPRMIDTRNDPRLSRIFANKVIKRYPAFAEFYGMEETIERIVSFFRHAAQGLEERKGEAPYNIELIAGSPDDANSTPFFEGAMSVLQVVVRSVVGDRAELAKVEFQLLDEQIQRISQIVTKLLQFAKPEEFAGVIDRQFVRAGTAALPGEAANAGAVRLPGVSTRGLDVDGAARVYDPIVMGERGVDQYGEFLKNYKPHPW